MIGDDGFDNGQPQPRAPFLAGKVGLKHTFPFFRLQSRAIIGNDEPEATTSTVVDSCNAYPLGGFGRQGIQRFRSIGKDIQQGTV